MCPPLPGDLSPVILGCFSPSDEGCYRTVPVETEIFDPDLGPDNVEIRVIVPFVRVSVLVNVFDAVVEQEIGDILLTVTFHSLALQCGAFVGIPWFYVMRTTLCGGEQFPEETDD